jgi:hypothetical protein
MLCYLLVHCRGTVLYFSEWDGKQGSLSLPEEDLPAGVIQLVLFDEKMNPLSERLIFSKNDATAEIEFHTDKEIYEKRDKVVVSLTSPSLWGRAGVGLSVAVTDDKDIAVDESVTILSSLLLSSELKGYIENPAHYLHNDAAMDLLMMTHGWRRYNVPEVVKGRTESPKLPFQTYQNLSGKVTALTGNRPIPGGEILMTTKGGGFGVTTTDANGFFTIPELDFPDSTTFYLQALDRNGRDNVKLTVDRELFPTSVHAPQTPWSEITKTDADIKEESGNDTFMEKAEQRAKFDEDIWSLQLGEVAITAPNLVKKIEPRSLYWANASSDQTITRETIEGYKFPFVVDYLRMIAGVRKVDNGVPGEIFIYLSGMNPSMDEKGDTPSALIVIDGMVDDYGYTLSSLSVEDIESIDVFRFAGATAFGVRGANGVVSITTRKGESHSDPEKLNHVVYTPLGYQKPVEF